MQDRPLIGVAAAGLGALRALVLAAMLVARVSAQVPEPESGAGDSSARDVIELTPREALIEECKYRRLVDERACNASLNKSRCIRLVIAECKKLADSRRDME
jgi:hypothetical protein